MSVRIVLEERTDHCSFVPLAVVGYCFTRSGLLQPLWSTLEVEMKVYDHTPTGKLQDVLVAIMAGCRSLAQVNSRLRPEQALATAWQRRRFAEQSTLSRALDALAPQQVDQLRAGHLTLLREHSQLCHHDWRQPVILDLDATSLLASKRAEGSRKGWVSGKKTGTVVTSSVSAWPAITRVFSPWPIPATAMPMSIVKRRSSSCWPTGRGVGSNEAG